MNNQINELKPIWEIKKPLLFHPWDIESRSRFIIIKSISIKLILTNLDDSYKIEFTQDGLSNLRLNSKKIDGILKRWSTNLPVDPPLLVWNNGGLFIEDGIHRINCAIALNALFIPLILNRGEYNRIITLLGVES